MSTENIITALIVVVAIIAATAMDIPYTALVLLGLGLVAGFMNPSTDMAERTGMLVLAVALPYVADNLAQDALGLVGEFLDDTLDNIAVGVAGMYIANFVIALIGRIKPA